MILFYYVGALLALAVIMGIHTLITDAKRNREQAEAEQRENARWKSLSSVQRVQEALEYADDKNAWWHRSHPLTEQEWDAAKKLYEKQMKEQAKDFDINQWAQELMDEENARICDAQDAMAIDRQHGVYKPKSSYGL